jgi:hypothetical protein
MVLGKLNTILNGAALQFDPTLITKGFAVSYHRGDRYLNPTWLFGSPNLLLSPLGTDYSEKRLVEVIYTSFFFMYNGLRLEGLIFLLE